MATHTILTPYFIDQHIPAFEAYQQPDWTVNHPALTDTATITARVARLQQGLAEKIASAAGDQSIISFSGDCMTSIGVAAGLRRAGITPTLIWFDAHGDFNTHKTSPSGFLGGMPLAMLVGRGDQTIMEAVNLTPIDESSVIITDARDLDPAEAQALSGSGVTHLPNVDDLLTHPLPDASIHVHFDVDVLSLTDAPAVAYPAAGGPDLETMKAVFERLAATGRIAAVSFSAWKLDSDLDGQTRDVCLSLLDILR